MIHYTNIRIIYLFLSVLISISINAQTNTLSWGCKTDEYLQDFLVQNNYSLAKLKSKSQAFTIKKSQISNDQLIIIPVVFNIIHQGEQIGTGKNFSVEKIKQQLDVLNSAYSNSNSRGIDTKIRFCLATKDVHGNPRSGIQRFKGNQAIYSREDDFKIKSNRSLFFPNNKYLNIWVCDLGNYQLGYSTFPFVLPPSWPAPISNEIDGVVINNKVFGINSNDRHGEGKTLIHESGHWLGLWHTFQLDEEETFQCVEIDCKTQGDEVCDTEPRKSPANTLKDSSGNPLLNPQSCNLAPKCSNPGLNTNSIQNYMDYNLDPCYKFFTLGQKNRMREMISIYRPDLLNYKAPVTECQTNTDPTNPNSGCFTPANTDYGFYIQDGASVGEIFMDGDLFGYKSSPNLIKLFKRDNCSIIRYGVISATGQVANYKNVDTDYVEITSNIVAKDEKIIASGFYWKNRSRYPFLVTFENSNGSWIIDQFIELDGSNYYNRLLANENEILILNSSRLIFFKHSNGNLSLFQNLKLEYNHSHDWTYNHFVEREGAYSYNGNQLIYLTKYPHPAVTRTKVNILTKDINGLFKQNMIEDIFVNYANVHVNKENEIFITQNSSSSVSLKTYKFSNNTLINEHNIVLSHLKNGTHYDEQVSSITSSNGVLILARNGAGLTFHDIKSNLRNFNIPLLKDSFPKNVLNPYDAFNYTQYSERLSSDFGNMIKSEGNIVLVKNSSCQRLYIYQLNNLLQGAKGEVSTNYKNLSLCSVPSKDLTYGNEILIGNNCNVSFSANSNKTIYNATKTVLKNGTVLNKESNTKLISLPYFGFDIEPSSCPLSLLSSKNVHPYDYQIFDKRIYAKSRISKESNNSYQIIPNPVDNLMKIISTSNTSFSYKIYNLLGKLVKDEKNSNSEKEIRFDNYPSGIYLIKIVGKEGATNNLRFIKN